MCVLGNVANGALEAARIAQASGNWLVDGPKNVLANVEPLSDVMKLVQRINDIFKPFVEIMPLRQIAEAFSHITDFVNARNFVGRISDLVSGKAGWDKPFSENFPDLLKIASKCAYLIGDFASTAKWLSMINILGAWVKDSTAQIVTWGKEFNILKGVGDVACITGALLNMADTVRLIVKEAVRDGYFKDNKLKLGLLVDHVLDVAYDTSKVAAAVLSNIPGVHIIFAMISLAIGSTLSLAKFFKKTYCIEEASKLPPPEDIDLSSLSSSRVSTPDTVVESPEEDEIDDDALEVALEGLVDSESAAAPAASAERVAAEESIEKRAAIVDKAVKTAAADAVVTVAAPAEAPATPKGIPAAADAVVTVTAPAEAPATPKEIPAATEDVTAVD
jgi:hypothetical protein